MHLHDEISRIADMDGISRVDVQGMVLDDLPTVTWDMVMSPMEPAVSGDEGSRLPSEPAARAGKDLEGEFTEAEIVIWNAKGRLQTKIVKARTNKALNKIIDDYEAKGNLREVKGMR